MEREAKHYTYKTNLAEDLKVTAVNALWLSVLYYGTQCIEEESIRNAISCISLLPTFGIFIYTYYYLMKRHLDPKV